MAVAFGIGDNHTRQRIAEKCKENGIALFTATHPSAVVAKSACVGEGEIINTAAIVEHDVVIGNYAHMSPNATTGGAAKLGELSHLGLGGVILPCVSVGANAIVGAGAVVVQNLPDNVVAMGVPARINRSIEMKA